MTTPEGPPRGLQRTLHRDYYRTEPAFARERERIFFREWFCFAREEEVAEAGAWLSREVAGESILLVRLPDGGLAAHYNVCRHRGSRLVPECGAGRFAAGIRCPYHSWTYHLDGRLRTAPYLDEADGVDRSRGIRTSCHRVHRRGEPGGVLIPLQLSLSTAAALSNRQSFSRSASPHPAWPAARPG